MSNDVERSESEAEAEKAAREYAGGYGHGFTIPSRMHKDIRDGLELVKHVAFLAGIEWERKRIRDTYCPSYVLAPTMANQGEAKLCHVIPVDEFKKEGGE